MEFEMLELLNLSLSQVQQFPSSVSSSQESQKGKYVLSPLSNVKEMEDISFPFSFHGMLIFINSSLPTLCLT